LQVVPVTENVTRDSNTGRTSLGKRRKRRKELTKNADSLQVLRLMAAASPELAGVWFLCDEGVARSRPSCREAHPSNPKKPLDHSRRSLFAIPETEAVVIRLPLRPTRVLSRAREPFSQRVQAFVRDAVAALGRPDANSR
jgi:hypothetical protein